MIEVWRARVHSLRALVSRRAWHGLRSVQTDRDLAESARAREKTPEAALRPSSGCAALEQTDIQCYHAIISSSDSVAASGYETRKKIVFCNKSNFLNLQNSVRNTKWDCTVSAYNKLQLLRIARNRPIFSAIYDIRYMRWRVLALGSYGQITFLRWIRNTVCTHP